jgi:hypothetical protein
MIDRNDALAAAFMIGATALGLSTQLPARGLHSTLRDADDANLLPPPQHTVVLSLGYRAALADLIWAQTLVLNGIRLQERRRFDANIALVDTINELDPTWRDPYRLVDTLVTMQTKAASLDQLRETRRILERGVRERPYDAGLWLVLGQFVGWIVPASYFGDEQRNEANEWREQGAEYLARAAELGSYDPNLQWQTLGAQRLFANMGQLRRAAEMYLSILATTDDPELRAELERRLDALGQQQVLGEDEERVTAYRARRASFEQLVRSHLPGTNGTRARLLGVPVDIARCAGGSRALDAASERCHASWQDWSSALPFGQPNSQPE